MILVNDNWEQVNDLQDVSKIIRENYNYDLADELDKLIPEYTDEEYEDLLCDYNMESEKITDLENEISNLEKENKRLEEKVEELETKIEEIEKQ